MNKWWWIAAGGVGLAMVAWTSGTRGLRGMQTGIDVSHYQGNIDWSGVKGSGYRFALLKVSDGQSFKDETRRYNAFEARTNRLEVGYYHYAQLNDIGSGTHIEDARLEALNFLAAISPLPGPLTMVFATGRTAAVWLDLEQTADNLNEQEGLEWILEWCRVVEEQGYPVGIYASEHWLDAEATPHRTNVQLLNRLDGTQRAFWVARYGQNLGIPMPQYDPNEKIPPEWRTWDIWQYTSKGQVAGIDGNCDLDLGRFP